MDEFIATKKWQQPAEIEKFDEEAIQCVPNWLIEVMKWITRIEMAKSSISISCRLFYKLCYSKLHGAVEPHIVPKLIFVSSTKSLKICKSNNIPFCDLEDITIAEVPPPPYILGFKSITFEFIDARVFQFVKIILPLVPSRILNFQSSILPSYVERDVLATTDNVRQLLTMLTSSISQIDWLRWDCGGFALCDGFAQNFPGILDNVQILCITIPSCDRTFIDVAFKWLIKSRIDGKPKFLYFGGPSLGSKEMLLNRIKEQFRKSTQPMTFFVHMQHWTKKFEMENNRTGEVLLLNRKNYIDKDWYLLRCTKGTENEWKEEGLMRLFSSEMRNATIFNVEWEKRIDSTYKKKSIFSKCFKNEFIHMPLGHRLLGIHILIYFTLM